jgi:cytochrome b6-f complex iron-sulfur subunit
MAERPSVKDILAMARKGGPAKPTEAAAAAPAAEEPAAVEESAAPPPAEAAPEPEPAAEPAAPAPAPAKLGRPLTLKEKLAAARAGGPPPAAAAPAPKAKPAAAPPPPAADEAETAAEAAPEPAKPVPAPAASPGRPLTLKEKLAAARSGGGAAAPASGAPAKPAAAKPAAAAAAAKPAAARTLPPLEKMSDPRDLAEALRQTGAKKTKEFAAKAAEAAPGKAAPAAKTGHKEAKPQSVPPKPSKKAALESAVAQAERRGFLVGSLFVSFVALGWTAFTAASVALTTLCVRFMFPNVLAEPPSTIKIGLPGNYEKEDVNERFKAEWGFWVVRSSRYNGQDILYAIKSVCTHLGCPPNWLAGEQKFKCPCHGSGFYISGINFEGPAPRPLERFKVALADDGQIVVDKSQIFQQELGQWEDPDSFIAV